MRSRRLTNCIELSRRRRSWFLLPMICLRNKVFYKNFCSRSKYSNSFHCLLKNDCYFPCASRTGKQEIRSCATSTQVVQPLQPFRERLKNGPTFNKFVSKEKLTVDSKTSTDFPPYLSEAGITVTNRKVFIEVYGCQMNVNDSEIVWSILHSSGYLKATSIEEADIILLVTCSIREGAEQKIWNRLDYLKGLRRKRPKQKPILKVGLLGCMAERLKDRLLEQDRLLDLVAGPDAYKDLPRLLSVASDGQQAINVMLSLDETYSDILPIRRDPDSPSAFVSIMRGCDNMCSYCIVPFTRGRERSRPMNSILNEISALADQGVKEVTLLGQNVNSYCDFSEQTHSLSPSPSLSKGFSPKFKRKASISGGLVFSDLLDKVSAKFPEIRIRFTSPHPKDFPDQVLHLIKERHNICNHLHLPAQSGNTDVLERMKRGYSREAYLDLVHHIRSIISDVALTSDFICGFCDETEEAHHDTISLLELVRYHFVYVFPYSMRKKTRAFHRLVDNVADDVKQHRVDEVVSTFRNISLELHKEQLGKEQLVLVHGISKRSTEDLYGRNDQNTKVILQQKDIPEDVQCSSTRSIQIGDYIAVKIVDCSSQVLRGQPLYHTTLTDWAYT